MAYYHRLPGKGEFVACPTTDTCELPHADHYVRGASSLVPAEVKEYLPTSYSTRSIPGVIRVIHAEERAKYRRFALPGVAFDTEKVTRGDLQVGDEVFDLHSSLVWTVAPGPRLFHPALPTFELSLQGPQALIPAYRIIDKVEA